MLFVQKNYWVPLVIVYSLLCCCRERTAGIAGMPQGERTIPASLDTIPCDTAFYRQKLLAMVHGKPSSGWPVAGACPDSGALLPFNRIVAYYGNLYSAGMGILGALPPQQMKDKLLEQVAQWRLADSSTPVIPALHYIAVTAQPTKGKDGKYRLRMPFGQIDSILGMAKSINALVFLDIQLGHSTLKEEIPVLRKYLQRSDVHLGIDPEYAMKDGEVPCSVIGSLDAVDINYAVDYLSELVIQYKLPPKILVIHRFTRGMVTNYRRIRTSPQVQIVMNMDGFGYPGKKIDSYKSWIGGEPVQYAGFKVFYKNDIQPDKWPQVMSPADILQLYPQPLYIQYQ